MVNNIVHILYIHMHTYMIDLTGIVDIAIAISLMFLILCFVIAVAISITPKKLSNQKLIVKSI